MKYLQYDVFMIILILLKRIYHFLYFYDCLFISSLFSMKRILTNSEKQIDKRSLRQRIGLKVEYYNKKLDLSSKQATNSTFQFSLAAALKENRLSNPKLKTQRKSRRKLLGQNIKPKERSRKPFALNSNSIKALSSQRFQRYCLTTLQTEYHSTKNDLNHSINAKDLYLGKSAKNYMNEIQLMKDLILSDFYQNNIPKQQQKIRQKIVFFHENTKSIIKEKPLNVVEQRNKIEKIIKEKIDPITDILNRITFLASHKKVNFSHILFLIYKLFYLKRVKNTEFLYKLTQQNQKDIQGQQYKQENDNIYKCMIEMLEKLKKSKKWKDVQPKWIYEKENFDQSEIKMFHAYVLERFIDNYCKLSAVAEENNQNYEIMHQFFIGFFELYQIQQDQNIRPASKQQYKRLKDDKLKPQIPQTLIFLKEIQTII